MNVVDMREKLIRYYSELNNIKSVVDVDFMSDEKIEELYLNIFKEENNGRL